MITWRGSIASCYNAKCTVHGLHGSVAKLQHSCLACWRHDLVDIDNSSAVVKTSRSTDMDKSVSYHVVLSLATWHHSELLKRRFLEWLAEVWVCDTDQLVRTMTKCFTKQVRNTVLSHHIMDMCTCRHHASACNTFTLVSHAVKYECQGRSDGGV